MKDQADILQHWIKIATVYGKIGQRPAEGIRGEDDKQQKAQIDHPHH